MNSIFKLLWKIDLLTRDHRKFCQFLDISACNNLKSLPDAIGGLASLETLDLNLCVKLSCLPETIGNLVRLQTLDVTCCFGQKSIPETLWQMTSLEYFSVFMCASMHKLPESIGKLTALKELNFRNCDELINIPVPIGKLKSLRSLDLSTAQWRKPSEFKVGKIYTEDMTSELTELHILYLDCNAGTALPQSISHLVQLEQLAFCGGEKYFPRVIHPSSWADICKVPIHLPSWIGERLGVNLKILHLRCNKYLTKLPDSIGKLMTLQQLNLTTCVMLERLPTTLGQLTTLKALWMGWCPSLEQVPKEMLNKLQQTGLLYLEVDYTIDVPTFRDVQCIKRLCSMERPWSEQMSSLFCFGEDWQSYLELKTIVLEHDLEDEFSRFRTEFLAIL
jgi:Leucine-rich repeat (LRR) protein